MRSLAARICVVVIIIHLALSLDAAFAVTQVVPTTTLAAQTGNNTSTSPSFAGTTNGNLSGNNNISKVSATTLLYPGSTTKIYAHFMPWFGGTNHLNVGYASDDPAQVARQVNDMRSRGLAGAIIDWYGPNKNPANTTSIYLKQEAEKYTDFDFAVTEDVGALKTCAATAGCDVTTQMIQDLTYAYNTFEQSPAYMRVGTRPLVFFFGVEAYTIDWTRVRNGVPGNPIFIFRNSGAFTHAQTGGGFSWTGLSSDPNNMGLGYIDNFYATGLKYPTLQSFGSAYKGFDDSIASWGKNRLLYQQCGQTWLTTMAEAGKYFSTSNQLEWMQLVTWNDYEEGTALEVGIDNCVTVAASLSATILSWTLTGQQNTVDHFNIFISLDGVNLMPLADVGSSSRALDMSTFSLAPGTYKLLVQAVGRPFLTNKMSGTVSYVLANQPPRVVLSATPTAGTAALLVSASTVGSADPDGSIASTKLDFGDGTVLSTASGSHSYTQPGNYILRATVTDNLGATASTSATIAVAAATNQPPVAKLSVTPSSGTAALTVTASTAGSSDPDGTIASTKIDFGDGTVVNATSANHVYSVAGSFLVKATVTDNAGASALASVTVAVTPPNKPPIAMLSVTPSSGTAALTVTASTAGSSDPDGTIASTKIDFGDGTVVSAASATHVYPVAGSFVVKATVTDNSGASASASATVAVQAPNKPPIALLNVTPRSGTAALTVNASTAGSSDPDGTIASTRIDFGDGTVLNAASGSHVYPNAGTFVVTATVTDNAGASTAASSTVTVQAPATAVTITSPTSNSIVSLWIIVAAKATSSVSISSMQIYLDGANVYQVTGSSVSKSLSLAPGGHTITVQAIDVNGGTAKSSVYVIRN